MHLDRLAEKSESTHAERLLHDFLRGVARHENAWNTTHFRRNELERLDPTQAGKINVHDRKGELLLSSDRDGFRAGAGLMNLEALGREKPDQRFPQGLVILHQQQGKKLPHLLYFFLPRTGHIPKP